MDRAYAVLRQNKVEHASSGPQRLPDWNKNAGGIKAFYFKDPDEHPVEILQIPRRQRRSQVATTQRPALPGIDHTAIVVSDTDASLKFYRDLPRFWRIAGASEKLWTEQEHLNNVFRRRPANHSAARNHFGPGIDCLNT